MKLTTVETLCGLSALAFPAGAAVLTAPPLRNVMYFDQ